MSASWRSPRPTASSAGESIASACPDRAVASPAEPPGCVRDDGELQDYKIQVDQNANDTYGAFKVGTHDDLVMSLGLAVQWAAEGIHAWDALEQYMFRQLGGR